MALTADSFVAMCLGKTKKARKLKSKNGVRIGFPEWGFSSVPGGNMSGAMPALPGVGGGDCGCGGGDGGGCCGSAACCGESVKGKDEFTTYLEGLGEQYPESDVVGQVKKMFADMKAGRYEPMYCSADGISTKKINQ